MYYEEYNNNEISKLRLQEAECQAKRNWRFRNLRSKESAFLTAVATSVLGLFTR